MEAFKGRVPPSWAEGGWSFGNEKRDQGLGNRMRFNNSVHIFSRTGFGCGVNVGK